MLFKHNAIWLLFAIILLPGLLGLAVLIGGERAIPKFMHTDYKLAGITKDKPTTPLDLSHFATHELQKYSEIWLTNRLPLRSFFIRMNNQIYYSIFRKSYAEDGRLVVGKSQQLFTDSYIQVYCGLAKIAATDSAELVAWADQIKKMSDFFYQHGKAFIYVITPSKAEYYPEAIPDRYRCKRRGISAHINTLTQLLDARKVPYVDGSTLMITATKKYGVPMFPQGGIHWNRLAASIAANRIIDELNQERKLDLQTLRFHYVMVNNPHGNDSDLLNLMNLLHPNAHYAIPKVTFHDSITTKPLTAAFIGGSFNTQLIDVFIANQTFKKISFYRYFKLDRRDFAYKKKPVMTSVDANARNTITEILKNDVIVLEENAEVTGTGHGKWFYTALQAAN